MYIYHSCAGLFSVGDRILICLNYLNETTRVRIFILPFIYTHILTLQLQATFTGDRAQR